jgi:glutamate synthase domain-containing protein 3
VDRAVGATIAGRITARFGPQGAPPSSVVLRLKGTAGQSLGAFLVPGLEIHLRGEANDYVGKGMHGGTISIRPRDDGEARSGDVRAGNAVLYGATGGSLLLRGVAGERFAVRNSGAAAVVEGIGHHGCEYMTGGMVVNLGHTGRNFGSGMTGGIAYVRADITPGLRGGDALDAQDWSLVESLLSRHWQLTGSPLAAALLGEGFAAAAHFRKFAPAAASSEAGARNALIALDRRVELRERDVLVRRVGHQK